ncbi:MAG: hypothetical protein RIS88_100 [Pseudomonadota bacterium]|jgi:hypothetical protein
MGPIKILVTSQKGGVGKSTLTANLAAYFAKFERRQVTLIDFDHQASSYQWIERAPVPGVMPVVCDLVTERDPQLAVLKMKQSLRAAERVSDLVIADLTWVNIFPQSLMLDFDMVLVPTSLSKVELASTIEFVSRFAQVFNGGTELRPQLALVPSRLHRTQDYLDIFTQHNFPVKFLLTSPLPFELEIQSIYGQDYIFNSSNTVCRDSFFQIGHELHEVAQTIGRAREQADTTRKVTPIWQSIKRRTGHGASVLDSFVFEQRSGGRPVTRTLAQTQAQAAKPGAFGNLMGLLRNRM